MSKQNSPSLGDASSKIRSKTGKFLSSLIKSDEKSDKIVFLEKVRASVLEGTLERYKIPTAQYSIIMNNWRNKDFSSSVEINVMHLVVIILILNVIDKGQAKEGLNLITADSRQAILGRIPILGLKSALRELFKEHEAL